MAWAFIQFFNPQRHLDNDQVLTCHLKFRYAYKSALTKTSLKQFLYPGQEHVPESQKSNGSNSFCKFEVFIIEIYLQNFMSPWTYIWTNIFTDDFQWLKLRFLKIVSTIQQLFCYRIQKMYILFEQNHLSSCNQGSKKNIFSLKIFIR